MIVLTFVIGEKFSKWCQRQRNISGHLISSISHLIELIICRKAPGCSQCGIHSPTAQILNSAQAGDTWNLSHRCEGLWNSRSSDVCINRTQNWKHCVSRTAFGCEFQNEVLYISCWTVDGRSHKRFSWVIWHSAVSKKQNPLSVSENNNPLSDIILFSASPSIPSIDFL